MKNYHIEFSRLSGQVIAPPSKSHTLRAILFASMAQGESVICDYLPSPDTEAMIKACCLLGAKIDQREDKIIIIGVDGKPKTPDDIIDAGNSGQVLRFVGAIAALTSDFVVLTGDHSVRHNRPIQPLIDGLSQLGVFCVSTKNDGYAPIIIKGPFISGNTRLNGEDSQPVSGLLIAAAFAEGKTQIQVDNPGEKPWIGLTLSWFDRLGIQYQHSNFEHYMIPGGSVVQGFEYRVPGDFSSMAYPMMAAIITQSEIIINNVDMQDAQGDKKIIEILQRMGANILVEGEQLIIKKNQQLQGCEMDINDCIDAITILAVAACYAQGTTKISGAAIARKKECNRLSAITAELQKMGAIIEETDDGLIIEGTSLRGTRLQTYQDHRMVMSLAVAALGAKGSSVIEDVGCVQKSYPNFLHDMQKLSCKMVEKSLKY